MLGVKVVGETDSGLGCRLKTLYSSTLVFEVFGMGVGFGVRRLGLRFWASG